ncbi:odorant receptor Or1-like [Zophobas morio]|uniref:odorant receptor Or1-like n=1 Tax=Zophobas morio TaxID=2755281 RepID=UPI0030839F94
MIPFFEDEMRLPIDIWLPCNLKSNPRIFRLVFVVLVFGVGNCAHVNAIVDTLLSGLLCHAIHQIRILKDNLQFLEESALKEEQFKNEFIYRKISKCVGHHEAILQFVANFEDLYSSAIFSQFLASIVVICITCLQMTMLEPLTFPFFSMVMFLMTMFTEIYFYCYYGTALYEESNTLTNAIYTAKWYDYDPRSKKALIILMERSKKPIVVTAGRILDLSLDTFIKILRRAYSLLAVFQNQ